MNEHFLDVELHNDWCTIARLTKLPQVTGQDLVSSSRLTIFTSSNDSASKRIEIHLQTHRYYHPTHEAGKSTQTQAKIDLQMN